VSKVKPEYVINHRGKPYTLYGGYLDAAHSAKLSKIDTELVQIPTAENGFTAVLKATVVTEKGEFSAYGDAHTGEQGPAKEAPIRMAETRAKRRALSDAVNAGNESEELSEEEAPQVSRQARTDIPRRLKAQPVRTSGGATKQQVDYLINLLVKAEHNEEKVRPIVEGMSASEVSEKIKEYKPKEESG
jgi:hypothetical protein